MIGEQFTFDTEVMNHNGRLVEMVMDVIEPLLAILPVGTTSSRGVASWAPARFGPYLSSQIEATKLIVGDRWLDTIPVHPNERPKNIRQAYETDVFSEPLLEKARRVAHREISSVAHPIPNMSDNDASLMMEAIRSGNRVTGYSPRVGACSSLLFVDRNEASGFPNNRLETVIEETYGYDKIAKLFNGKIVMFRKPSALSIIVLHAPLGIAGDARPEIRLAEVIERNIILEVLRRIERHV